MAERIQRKRTKGWRMPKGAISVARPSRYGNPFMVVGNSVIGMNWAETKEWDCGIGGRPDVHFLYVSGSARIVAVEHAVDLYRKLILVRQRDWEPARFEKWIRGARGHDLACYCPLDQPCHADVLLELANQEVTP